MSTPGPAEWTRTLDAFVSYARLDSAAVFAVVEEARRRWHRTMWVDQDGIPSGAPWRVELGTAIEAANAVVFCLSPNWSASQECRREYDRALALGKRLIPVMFAAGGAVPNELAALQRIDAGPGSDPAAVAAAVVTAIDVDHERVREHTDWLAMALRWDEHGRGRAHLLRGKDLRAAEGWLARGDVAPTPIPLQHALVTASRTAERRRMATALGAAVTTLALTAALAVTAVVQRGEAVAQRDQAQSRALAAASQNQLDVDPERALLLASAAWAQAPTSQAVTALRSSVERSRVRTRVAAHRDLVSGLTWSADGNTVISAGRDGALAAWDAVTGAPRGGLRLGPDAVEKIVGSQAGVAIDGRGRAVLWSLDPQLRQRAVLAESGVTDVAEDGDVVALGMTDGTVRIMTSAGEPRTTVRWAATAVRAVALADRGATLLVSAEGGRIAAGPASAPRPVVIPAGAAAETVQLSTDGSTALVAADDGSAGLYATRDGHRIRSLPTTPQVITMAPSGATAVAAQTDGRISLSLASGPTVPLLDRGIAATDVRFSVDGTSVSAATLDGVTRVWGAADGSPLAVLRGDGSPTQQAVLSPDGRMVATGHNDGSVRVWAMPARPLPLAETGAASVDFAPDGRTVLTAGLVSAARDTRTGRATVIGSGCPTPGRAGCLASGEQWLGIQLSRVRYRPDGKLIAAASLTGDLTFWDAATSGQVAHAPAVPDAIDDIAFSPDGTLLATAERRGAARIVESRTGTVIATLPDPRREPVDAVAFTADGYALLTVDDSGTLHRRDLGDNAAQAVPRAVAEIGERPLRMAVDPGGRYIAIGTISRIVLLDAASGRILRTLAGHTGFVTGVTFSPDGNLLFSGGQDGTVRVWDLPSGEQAGVEQVPGGDVSYIAVDRTGHRIAAVTTGATGYIFDCEYCGTLDELARVAAQHATRPLTDAERATFGVP